MTTVPNADLLLRDAPVYRDGSWVGDRLAIRDGRIVGRRRPDDLTHLADPRTEVESLAGRWLLPAFHDSHVHPVQAGTELNLCNLADLDSVQAYLDRITSYAAEHPATPVDHRWRMVDGRLPRRRPDRRRSLIVCARTVPSTCPTGTTTRRG